MKTMQGNHISSYIIQSQEDELKRIALELHEGVGQTLYSLYTGLQFIEAGINQPATKRYVKEMEQLLEKTIQEVRLLSVELHPPTLTTLGLLPAMKNYAKLYTSTFGIEVEVDSKGKEFLIPEQKNIALFRVCQEALANIAKYADTSEAKISFTWEGNHLIIEISDNGKGFIVNETIYTSLGLAAMKERMSLVGGKCIITSKIGAGTLVKVLMAKDKLEQQTPVV
jgi:signal transduction histidine kinase